VAESPEPSAKNLDARVAQVEKTVRAYADLGEANNELTDTIRRLVENTNALTAILSKVDNQQQTLTQLGRQIAQVEKSSIEVDSKLTRSQQDLVASRRRIVRRVYAILATAAILGAGALIYSNHQAAANRKKAYAVCLERNKQVLALQDYFKRKAAVDRREKTTPPEISTQRVQEDLRFVNQYKIVNCKALG
jgi:ABC-type transporter Mla subunit MlaD